MKRKFINYYLTKLESDKTIVNDYKVLCFKYGSKDFHQGVDDLKFIEKCCKKLNYEHYEKMYDQLYATLIATLNISKWMNCKSFEMYCKHVCFDYVLYSIIEASILPKSRSAGELPTLEETTFESTLPDINTISFLELPKLKSHSK